MARPPPSKSRMRAPAAASSSGTRSSAVDMTRDDDDQKPKAADKPGPPVGGSEPLISMNWTPPSWAPFYLAGDSDLSSHVENPLLQVAAERMKTILPTYKRELSSLIFYLRCFDKTSDVGERLIASTSVTVQPLHALRSSVYSFPFVYLSSLDLDLDSLPALGGKSLPSRKRFWVIHLSQPFPADRVSQDSFDGDDHKLLTSIRQSLVSFYTDQLPFFVRGQRLT